MTAIERFFYFLDNQGLKHTPTEKKLGFSNGYLGKMRDRNASIGSEVLEKIVGFFPELNIEWLVTGNGEMLKTETTLISKPLYESRNYKPKPFIADAYATLGQPNGFSIAVKADQCEQISIPFVSDYDFSIKGRGDSMINRKNPDRSICDGDLIACKLWTSRSHVRWGQVYALATSEGVVVKQIKKSNIEGHIQCVSFNEEDGYDAYDLPAVEIYDWALVVSVTHTSKW